jgi:hypothetical protein
VNLESGIWNLKASGDLAIWQAAGTAANRLKPAAPMIPVSTPERRASARRESNKP